MKKYFLLSWKYFKKGVNAFSSEANTKLDHELISSLEGKIELTFEFELKKITEKKDGLTINNLTGFRVDWLDYLPNNLACPLLSEKFKTLIENYLTGSEGIDWITCNINGNNEQRTYYILRFNKVLDVIDVEKTLFVNNTDHIIKPSFSLKKVAECNIFNKPSSYNLWKITPALYVSDELKKTIQKAKITGVDFEETTVVEMI